MLGGQEVLMRVIIAGGGEFGARLAEQLAGENEVIVIEKDEGRAEYLGEKLSSIVLFGDATEKQVLKHANAEKCDALLAATGDDKANSAICGLAKSFGIRRLAARLNDPGRTDLFSDSGATSINIMDSAVREFRKAIEQKPHK
jgi:trk system potassium uptake protein TrkA